MQEFEDIIDSQEEIAPGQEALARAASVKSLVLGAERIELVQLLCRRAIRASA